MKAASATRANPASKAKPASKVKSPAKAKTAGKSKTASKAKPASKAKKTTTRAKKTATKAKKTTAKAKKTAAKPKPSARGVAEKAAKRATSAAKAAKSKSAKKPKPTTKSTRKAAKSTKSTKSTKSRPSARPSTKQRSTSPTRSKARPATATGKKTAKRASSSDTRSKTKTKGGSSASTVTRSKRTPGSRPGKDSATPTANTKVAAIETESEASRRAVEHRPTARRQDSTSTPTATARKSSRAKAKPKPKRRADGRQPGQAMRVPPPMTDVLITSDLPDVRRARIAEERQEGARGHLTPDSSPSAAKTGDWEDPIDASLMMSALAVDVSPKIEDNYDYSLLDEFEASGHCPRPTRMVNTACGGGEAAVHFAKKGFRCVGIDADRGQIGLARERAWLAGVDIDFMVGDLFETPNLLPAESFGLAIDRGGFSSLEDDRARQRYLANVRRLLFQGGVFLLSAGFFPTDDDKRARTKRQESKVLLAREGGVVVGELMQGGFQLLERVLRPTQDSGELAELLLYLRKP